jgi:hypothetical protein
MNNAWRRTATLLTAIAILAALALACSTAKAYETDKANKRIVAANADIEKYNSAQKQIDADQEKINATPGTPDGFSLMVPFLTDIDAKLKAQKTEIEKSIAEFTAGKALYIPGEFKTYFQMLIDVAKKQEESIDLTSQANQEYLTTAKSMAAGTATEDSLNAIKAKVDDLEARAKKAGDEATVLKTKADKYYKDKALSGSK